MPFSGDTVSRVARASAMELIDRTMGAAGHAALEVGDARLEALCRAPFGLVEHDHAAIREFIPRFRASLVCTDNGTCFDKAMHGVHMLGQELGVGRSPTDDVFAGAIAISRHQHLAGGYNGGFHATLAFRIRGERGVYTADPLPDHYSPEALARWSKDPDPILLRPWAGTGLWTGARFRSRFVNDEYFRFGASQLKAMWMNPAEHGVTVR